MRLALRELRGGISGLRILTVCLVLGVAALAGVGSLADAINAGLAAQGREVLGGDVAVTLSGRQASATDQRWLAGQGRLVAVTKLRGMASRVGAGDALPVLAEVKAVGDGWPLYGKAQISGGGRITPGTAAVQPALADRLGLKAGDTVTLGQLRLRYIGTLDQEPDRAGDGFGFGPGMVIHQADLPRAGLLAPGSLYRSEYR